MLERDEFEREMPVGVYNFNFFHFRRSTEFYSYVFIYYVGFCGVTFLFIIVVGGRPMWGFCCMAN